MCGFTGFCGSGDYDRSAIIKQMSDTIIHRGPDSEGFFADDAVALGFRRLSIIDLSKGDQPIVSEDGRYVIVFNGEIYNYRELKKQLIEEGMPFRTDCDTEVILKSYIRYGKDCVAMLRGMFAFVIYDTISKSLFGARDPFGIKPFYYAEMDGHFIFGSEIKSFLPHPAFKKKLNRDVVKLYLEFQYSPLEETVFKNVFKLQPGYMFSFSQNDGMKKETYFDAAITPVEKTMDDAVRMIDEAVLSSVEYHQIADVEVGSFLSGGVDSSYIASTVKPMKTYSVGFQTDGFDETSLAAGLCKILNMPNSCKEISAEEFFSVLPEVQYHSDEPHANLSAVPLYFLSELASRDVKVVLSGEGADEFFGGYDWYIQSDSSVRYKKLPLPLRKFNAKLFGHFPSEHVARFFRNGAENVEDTYIGQAFIMGDDEADSLLRPDYRSSLSFKDVTKPYYDKVKGCDDLTKKLYLDMKLWLPGDILLKADKMTMAHSLELRVPYLDQEVWKVASSLLSKQKMQGRHTKIAFRKAAFRHIPPEWANRKKAGFMVPFKNWIKEDRFSDVLLEEFGKPFADEIFDTEKLKNMLEEHKNGKKNNARRLYTVYSFLLWYEQYFVLR